MRFDVFEFLGPSLFGTRARDVADSDRRDAVLVRKANPQTESSDYPEAEHGVTLETGLADPCNPSFRCMSRHQRWTIVHHLTHATTIQ